MEQLLFHQQRRAGVDFDALAAADAAYKLAALKSKVTAVCEQLKTKQKLSHKMAMEDAAVIAAVAIHTPAEQQVEQLAGLLTPLEGIETALEQQAVAAAAELAAKQALTARLEEQLTALTSRLHATANRYHTYEAPLYQLGAAILNQQKRD
jgi:HD superfamily phosphohydrolase YqeK